VRQEVEEALALWRDAVQRRDEAEDGHRADLDAEVELLRDRYQQLTADYMMDRIDALKEAESRRARAVPSTEPFHEAARDEVRIADEIWNSAVINDRDVPKSH
jgi:hypothetical protein